MKDKWRQIVEDEEAKHEGGKEYSEELYRVWNTVDEMVPEKNGEVHKAVLAEGQTRFRPGWSIKSQLFVMRQISEKQI